jgi:hypothetical protein
MNVVQKRLSVLGLTVALTFLVSVPLYGSAGTRHIFYLDSGGHVHQLYSTASGWSDVDVTAITNAAVAVSGSALTSFLDHTTNYAYVYYLGTNHHVYELYGTGTAWVSYDPTFLAGAPVAASGSALTSFIDNTNNNSIPHVFYMGTNQNVYELYYTSTTGTWHSDDPTTLAGAPVATAGGSLTSFLVYFVLSGTLQTTMQVFYVATNGQIYDLDWGSFWSFQVPSVLAHAPAPASGSALTSFVDETNDNAGKPVLHVFYLGTNENVDELYYTSAWHSDDPTSLAGAPVAVSGSALSSFINIVGGDTGMHVMYRGTNEHLYGLHWVSGPSWSYFDATTASHGVSAASGSALVSFQDLGGGTRVYFLATNSHVYELYWQSEGTASETDLTVASGGTIAASGSAVSGVVGP